MAPCYAGSYKLYLRDSYLILPASLRSLTKSFSVLSKSYFPFEFVNSPNVDLEYVGPNPTIYQPEVILPIVQETSELGVYPQWSLRKEAIKYCEQDCVTLYQILTKFSEEVTSTLGVSLKNTPTTSSLALKSFLTNYYKPEVKLPIITGEPYNFIKQSYTGGHVDVYIPHGHDLYYYDVNSLYPHSMLSLMPVGNPIYFEGDINSIHSIKNFTFEPNSKNPMNRPYGFLFLRE